MARSSKVNALVWYAAGLLSITGAVIAWPFLRDYYFPPYAVFEFEAPRALDTSEQAAVRTSLESRARLLDDRKTQSVQAASDHAFRVYVQGASNDAREVVQWLGRPGYFESVIQASNRAQMLRSVPSTDGFIPLSAAVLLRNEHVGHAFLVYEKESDNYYISLSVRWQYGRRFADLTAHHAGKVLVMMMDGQVLWRATLSERIDNGRLTIRGPWHGDQGRVVAQRIVNLLRSPPAPCAVDRPLLGRATRALERHLNGSVAGCVLPPANAARQTRCPAGSSPLPPCRPYPEARVAAG